MSQANSNPTTRRTVLAGIASAPDATAYVRWLEKKTGRAYRLLSEAEWEYLARAGTTTRYFFGDDEKAMCCYGNGANCSDGYDHTSPASSFAPNGFGLYEMHGNAWQWVEDCYHYNFGAPSNGSAWTFAGCVPLLARGGAWISSDIRAAVRCSCSSGERRNDVGFRLG